MPKSLAELQQIAKRVRREIIEMIGAAKSGHPGGSLSAVEILVELYFDHMKIDPKNPTWPDRDRFILSKGHAAPVLYAVMAEAGYAETPVDQLNTLRKLGSVYQGHPDMRFIPALEASTGSLGEGLSLGIGMGLAARLDERPFRTYVMLGDGEIQEGQVWEAAMSAAFHKIDNVVAIVDYNGIQLDGFVKDIMEVAPLADKWRAFGWHTLEINGHDIRRHSGGAAGSRGHQGQAHLPRGPHGERQRRFLHGEQSQVPRHGADRRRSQTGPTGAAITMPAQTKPANQIRTETGTGHPRGLRAGAGGTGA